MPSHIPFGSQTLVASTSGAGVKLREALKDRNTAIIVDTLHFETLGFHDLDGTIIGLESLMAALGDEGVSYHLWSAVKQTIDERTRRGIDNFALSKASLERFLVEVGHAAMDRVDGPQFIPVDPRRCENASSIVRNARRLSELYAEKDALRGKLVVSIPATDEGMKAAKELETVYHIHTNLYGVCSLLHAAACAEAGPAVVTIPVGRLLHAYERKRRTLYENLAAHPGVETIQSILAYFKLHGIGTKVVGSEFRNLTELGELATFDAVCLSRAQAKELCWSRIPVSPPPPLSSPAHLRARQAQYPTAFLSRSSPGFMNIMSPATRDMVFVILDAPLIKWHAMMDHLERMVAEEVVRQFELRTMDLKTLFKRSEISRRKDAAVNAEVIARKVGGDIKGRRERSLAKALEFDEEEVF